MEQGAVRDESRCRGCGSHKEYRDDWYIVMFTILRIKHPSSNTISNKVITFLSVRFQFNARCISLNLRCLIEFYQESVTYHLPQQCDSALMSRVS